MANERGRRDRGDAAGPQHRKAFVVGTLVGAGAGVVSAFLNAPRSGRATRAQIQQGIEGVLFKVLDMRPTRLGRGDASADLPSATITELTPAAPPMVAASDARTPRGAPNDIVIDGPRPSDLHA